MNLACPPCWVTLHRLTDEEINRRYSDAPQSEISSFDYSGDSLDSFFQRNCTQRRKRRKHRFDSDEFELFRKHREHFFTKRSRISDDSLTSQGTHSRKKKKGKKTNRYERDTEWNPHVPKQKRVRRAQIESDSSSSDEEEDSLFEDYFNEMNCSEDTTGNPQPSGEFNSIPAAFSEHDSISCEKSMLETSHVSSVSSLKSPGDDILSGIMKDMDACPRTTGKTVSKTHRTLLNGVSAGEVHAAKIRIKRVKRSVLNNNIDIIAQNVIQQLLNKVCAEENRQQPEKSRNSKLCKWCSSPFNSSDPCDILCRICHDLGRDKCFKTTPIKISFLKKTLTKRGRPPKSLNKAVKTKSTRFQVLQKLPKNEMQRLMYSEKRHKKSTNKGHCENFPASDVHALPAVSDETPNFLKSSEGLNKRTKSSLSSNSRRKRPATELNLESDISKMKVDKSGLFPLNFPGRDDDLNIDCSKKKAAQKDGLVQLSFPGRDDDLKIVSLRPNASPQADAVKPNRFNGSSATSSNRKFSSEKIKSKQAGCDYLIPPVPTVLVANYSSFGDNGHYQLASIYYQNKYTQKTSGSELASTSKEISLAPILPSNNIVQTSAVSLNAPNLATLTVLPSTSSSNQSASMASNSPALAVTTVALDRGLNQIQSFMNNSMSISMTPSASSVPSNGLPMPVLGSVVSLHDKNAGQIHIEDKDIFMAENFVNSEQLQIKITGVASKDLESSTNHVTEKESAKPANLSQDTDATAENFSESIGNLNLSSKQNSETDLSASEAAEEKSEAPFRQEAGRDAADKSANELDAINSAIEVLDAISILAVIDLDPKGSLTCLNNRMQGAKSQLAKLNSEKSTSSEQDAKLASCRSEINKNIKLFKTAHTLLNRYGSFTKVSDSFLRRYQLIQIKKEKMEENEEESSCQFSKSPSLNSSFSHPESLATLLQTAPRGVGSMATSHIEKLQQFAAMNNNEQQAFNANFSPFNVPQASTVHHFAGDQFSALTSSVCAPVPVTPINETVVEARETPSRGSGPMTPSRPESATSQPEELAITALKKELMEVTTSSPCAFSQNSNISPISSQMPLLREMMSNVGTSSSNMSSQLINSAPGNVISGNNMSSQVINSAPGNVTLTYQHKPPPQYNQNFSNILFNIASDNRVQNSVRPPSGQLLVGQQVCLQNNPMFAQQQRVPSVNNNQYVIQAQNGNALLTNVSNQQFYTPSQVPQMYAQQSPISPHVIPNQLPTETAEQMFCAVCNKIATLRCKQCAKVAYCNTACAKTYWHQRHKTECKRIPSFL